MTHKTLQRMCYFAQAWHLGYYNEPLTSSQFQAWIHGPVSPDLYIKYKKWGWNLIQQPKKNVKFNDPEIAGFLDKIYQTYKDFTELELSQIAQSHDPWKNARIGIKPSHYFTQPISQFDMRDYYARLIPK